MKKTLKLVGIFIAILTIGITGGLSVYFLIQNNKTYYIYDLRIVEPIAEASTYLYVNKENTYFTLKNQSVYMTADSDNLLEIAIFADTTNGARNLKITSSDSSVAGIVYIHGKCYVEYKKAGVATITASIDMVEDSFDIYVYNRSAEEFNVYDNTYYGKYAEMFANKVVAYADDNAYEYDFSMNSAFYEEREELETEEPSEAEIVSEENGENASVENSDIENAEDEKVIVGDDFTVNGNLLEIDKTTVNEDVFSDISIDASTRKITIQCKASLSQTLIEQQKLYLDESFVVQAYYYSTEGEKKPSKAYVVNVHVIADTPEFLQVEMSATPDFANSYILMDTLDFTRSTEDEIIADIDNFLNYQKAEQYLAENEELSTYKAFFTNKISEIYLKFRKVYTNGDIVYLNEITKEDGNPFTLTCDEGYLTLSQNKEYYTLKVDKDYFMESEAVVKPFTINLKLDDFTDFDSTFTFEFKEFSAENVTDFYDFDSSKMIFTYKYWDLRTRYNNEICDASGNVIDFGGISIDFDALMPEETPEQEINIKFISDLTDNETGKAIFNVVLGVPFELNFECEPVEYSDRVTFTIVDDGSAANRSRFSFVNGVITVSNSDFEQIEIKIELDGYSDNCFVRLNP